MEAYLSCQPVGTTSVIGRSYRASSAYEHDCIMDEVRCTTVGPIRRATAADRET